MSLIVVLRPVLSVVTLNKLLHSIIMSIRQSASGSVCAEFDKIFSGFR